MENWEHINAVQRMQDYIAAHIREPITLYMLSRAAGYSPWHTSRIFKELMGRTPLEYIRSFRLSRAALELWDDGNRIIDVALEFAFHSHEGFTRAFSEQFGVTPQHYRKKNSMIQLFMPGDIRPYHLMMQKGAVNMAKRTSPKTVFVQVVERPARKLIIRRGFKADNYFDYCGEVGCEVWGELCSIKQALYEPIGMWLADNLRENGTSIYAQGVEVPLDYEGDLPDHYDIIELPACKMMVFQGPPFKDDEFMEAIEDLWAVMQTYDPEVYGFQWADQDGPRFQMAPVGERGYIEARPVRPV